MLRPGFAKKPCSIARTCAPSPTAAARRFDKSLIHFCLLFWPRGESLRRPTYLPKWASAFRQGRAIIDHRDRSGVGPSAGVGTRCCDVLALHVFGFLLMEQRSGVTAKYTAEALFDGS